MAGKTFSRGLSFAALILASIACSFPAFIDDLFGRTGDVYTVWYVAVDGDNANSCLTLEEACATVNAAVRKASDFDRIEVGPGTFDGEFFQEREEAGGIGLFREGVLVDKPLTIIGAGIGRTFIFPDTLGAGLGSITRPGIVVRGPGADAIGSVTIRDLTVVGESGVRIGSSAIRVENRGVLQLENVVVRGDAIRVQESTAHLTDVTVSAGPRVWGLQLLQDAEATVENSVFNGNAAGIYILEGGGSLTARDSTFTNNGTGVGTGNDGGMVTLENVTITGGGRGLDIRTGRATVSDSYIADNDLGMRVYSDDGRTEVFNTTIENNASHGVQNEASLLVEDVRILNNGGDGIYNQGARFLTVRRTLIQGNDGGGIYGSYLEVVSIEASEIADNNGIALFNSSGEMTVYDTYIHDNTTDGDYAVANTGTMTIERSTIANNDTSGGGLPAPADTISNREPGSGSIVPVMVLANVTISGNSGWGIDNTGRLTLDHVTVADNGEIGVFNLGEFHMQNSLVIGHAFQDCHVQAGTHTSAGQNLYVIGSCSGLRIPAGTIDLLPLADNGGPTPTRALGPSSPAIDAASGASPRTDQRGEPRPFGPASDVGAFERISGVATSLETGATINTDTLCWEGPGAQYDVVSSVEANTPVDLVGVGQLDELWFVIDSPRFPGVNCWVDADDLDVAPDLDIASLEVFPVPPLPTPTFTPPPEPTIPGPPANFKVSTICNANEYSVALSWDKDSEGLLGYRVYRDGQLIAEPGPDASEYKDAQLQDNGPHNYVVEAYNEAGAAQSGQLQDQGCVF